MLFNVARFINNNFKSKQFIVTWQLRNAKSVIPKKTIYPARKYIPSKLC